MEGVLIILSRWCTLSHFATPLTCSNHETKGSCSPTPSFRPCPRLRSAIRYVIATSKYFVFANSVRPRRQSLGSRTCRHLRTQCTHTCPQQLTHMRMPDTSRARTLDALHFVDVHLDAHTHILVRFLDACSTCPCIHLMRTTFMSVQ